MTLLPHRFLLMLCLLCSLILQNAQAEQVLDRVVASVNDSVITDSELNRRLSEVRAVLRAKKTPIPAAQTLKRQVLDQLITQRLLLAGAETRGIQVSTAELDKAVRNIAQDNHMSLAQFRQTLAQQGLNYSRFRDNVHQQMIIGALEQQVVAPGVRVSDEAVNNAIKHLPKHRDPNTQYHLKHILIALPTDPTPEQVQAARHQASLLQQRLKRSGGTRFSKVAVSASNAQEALTGGDLGWRTVQELPSLFTKIAPKMRLNQIKGPIRSTSGFHFIQLVGRRVPKAKAQSPDEIRQLLWKREYNHALAHWIKAQRARAHITVLL